MIIAIYIFGIDICPQAGINIKGVPVEVVLDIVETIEIAPIPEEVDSTLFNHMGLAEVTLLLDYINKNEQNYQSLYTFNHSLLDWIYNNTVRALSKPFDSDHKLSSSYSITSLFNSSG
jgi:hypothetical protein